MNQLVEENAKTKFVAVPKVGHSSSDLTKPCQAQFNRMQRVKPSPLNTFRTRESENGEFKLVAIFRQQYDTHVKLLDTKQREVSVPKSKLSDADLEVLDTEK